MFLKISTTYEPATDLGFLLRKNPANLYRADLSFGEVLLFYSVATRSQCEAVLMLDVDPVRLVRGRMGRSGEALLDHYVNDRPYAASSFLSVAMARSLRDAMAGRAPERSDLAATPIPLQLSVSPLPCRGGAALVEKLFEPLGYTVQTQSYVLDQNHPDWGNSPYLTVTLSGTKRVSEALTHVYVLVPVLDNAKHYWVGEDEVEKLIEKGGEWLHSHPERDLIAKRYLKRRRYARQALELLDERFAPHQDENAEEPETEDLLEQPLGLNQQRYEAVARMLEEKGVRKVCDLGCGEGKLVSRLLQEKHLERIIGIEVSSSELEKADRRLKLERMPPSQRARVDLFRGSLVYDDDRLKGVDAVTLIEVIEHVDPERLGALERVVFHTAAPRLVIVTTPNKEFNVTFENMMPGTLRHWDHRFEWTRNEFEGWSRGVCDRNGYQVDFRVIGDVHEDFGGPTQMAVFSR